MTQKSCESTKKRHVYTVYVCAQILQTCSSFVRFGYGCHTPHKIVHVEINKTFLFVRSIQTNAWIRLCFILQYSYKCRDIHKTRILPALSTHWRSVLCSSHTKPHIKVDFYIIFVPASNNFALTFHSEWILFFILWMNLIGILWALSHSCICF